MAGKEAAKKTTTTKTTTSSSSSGKVKKCQCTPTFVFDIIAIVALFLCPVFFIINAALYFIGVQYFGNWILVIFYSLFCIFLGMAPFNWVLFTRKYLYAFHSPVWRPALIIFMGFQICPATQSWASASWNDVISLIIALVLIILGIIILIIDLIWVGMSKCRSLPEGESGTLPTVSKSSKAPKEQKITKKTTTTTTTTSK